MDEGWRHSDDQVETLTEMSHLTLVLVQLFFHSKFGIGENGSFSFDHREKIVHAEEQTSTTIDFLNAERERGERRRRFNVD